MVRSSQQLNVQMEKGDKWCPSGVPENIQGQVGWGYEQPDLVVDVPARCTGIGLDDL